MAGAAGHHRGRRRRPPEGEGTEHGTLPEPPVADHQPLEAEGLDQRRQHHGADGEQGRPSGLHARKRQAGVEVERAEALGQVVELARRELHLVHLEGRHRPRRWHGAVEHHGQAGQGAHGATAGDGPGAGLGAAAQDRPDGLGPLHGQVGQPGPVADGEPLAAVELAAEAGGAERHAGHGQYLVGVADAGLQAAAPEVEAEDRLGAHPHPGALAQEAEPGLFLAGEQGDGAPEDPLEPGQQGRSVGGVPEGGGGHGHHQVRPRVVGGGPEAVDGPHRRGRPVGGDPTGPGHLGAEVEERPPAQHRLEHAVPGGVHHHQVEGAAPQVEDGNADGRHRRDATGCAGGRGRPTGRARAHRPGR